MKTTPLNEIKDRIHLANKITSMITGAKGQFERMAITLKYVHDLNINREEGEIMKRKIKRNYPVYIKRPTKENCVDFIKVMDGRSVTVSKTIEYPGDTHYHVEPEANSSMDYLRHNHGKSTAAEFNAMAREIIDYLQGVLNDKTK